MEKIPGISNIVLRKLIWLVKYRLRRSQGTSQRNQLETEASAREHRNLQARQKFQPRRRIHASKSLENNPYNPEKPPGKKKQKRRNRSLGTGGLRDHKQGPHLWRGGLHDNRQRLRPSRNPPPWPQPNSNKLERRRPRP